METNKRKREEAEMEIVWQTPSNPPQRGDYIFRNGIRYVRPYYFEFICHGKNSWAGKTIVDVFAAEFKGRPYDYYVSAVRSGRIQVDGQRVSISFIVKSSQRISHFLHRHEPPVMAWEVSILQKDPDVLAVCKPATVPVHPCGQYRKNTVVGILEAEHDLAPLFPIHRLDRLVSGLLILARSASKADFFRQQIEAGEVQKQYIAKVIGEFPEEKKVVNANVIHNPREGMSTVEVANGDSSKGKAACTIFTRISTNGTHSIVLCEPITGRTHQIRVHLQHTGHPIANDNLYLYEFVRDRSTQGLGADRAAAKLARSRLSNPCEESELAYEDKFSQVSNPCEEDEFTIDPVCTNCPNLHPKGYEGYEEGLWLHCYRYTGPGWSYECPYPNWASLD